MSDKNSEKDTEFHYPAGKFDEELVEAPHGGWASDDFNEEEFDFEFDDSNFDDSEFGEAITEMAMTKRAFQPALLVKS